MSSILIGTRSFSSHFSASVLLFLATINVIARRSRFLWLQVLIRQWWNFLFRTQFCVNGLLSDVTKHTQVEQPRSLTTIYGLIRPSWPYFTVTLRVTWLRITTVFLHIVYDEIRSSTGTRKCLLIIIVDVLCTLFHAYIVYGPKRHITEIVFHRKRLVYPRKRHGEKRS